MEYALAQDDFVGISFWLATAIMLASTVFFLAERDNVRGKWKTSLTVAALVTGVAFLALSLYERCLDYNWRFSNCIQIY